MKARLAGFCCALLVACGIGQRGPSPRSLPTLAHPSIKPGQRLRLIGSWGNRIWSGRGARAVAFMPDGKSAVSAGDGDIVVFEIPGRRVVGRFAGHKHGVESVAASPDGSTIATGGGVDRTIVLWNARTGQKIRTIAVPDAPGFIQAAKVLGFSPDGGRLVAACTDRQIVVFDARTGARVWSRGFEAGPVGAIGAAFSPDGKLVAGASTFGGVAVWDAATGQPLWETKQKAGAVAFNGSKLAASGRDGLVVYDARTGAVEDKREGRDYDQIEKLTWAPGAGGQFVTADYGGVVTVWSAKKSFAMQGHYNGISDIAVAPDGRYAVSAASDDGIRVWDVARHHEVSPDGHGEAVVALGLSADGARLTSIGGDGSVLVWDVVTGAMTAHRNVPLPGVIAAAFSPDGRSALAVTSTPMPSGDRDFRVQLLDAATGAATGELEFPYPDPMRAAFSADGRAAVVIGSETSVAYDLARPPKPGFFRLSGSRGIQSVPLDAHRVALLADGDLVVVTGWVQHFWHDPEVEHPGGVVRLGQSGARPWTVPGGMMGALAVSADGRTAFAGNTGGDVFLVDVATGKVRWSTETTRPSQFEGMRSIVEVALSPDGDFAAASDADGRLYVWSAASGEQVDRVEMTVGTALAFARDSRSLYAADVDGMIFRFAL